MSNYTKSTNFATKDNLTPGDPLKVVRGTEIDTEYNNIATAIATKTDNSAAAITGGSITGITDLAVADGGTGASTAAGALNNLLPSQTSAANKYLQSDGTNASWDAVTLSTADITGTLAVANGGTGVTTSTGTTNVVLSNSPTLVTPALGTPSSAVLTNATGLPISTGVSGLGTGVATFLGTPSSANLISAVTDETGTGSLVFATSPTLVTPALGTPSALVGTNITGTASGLTAGNVTTNANLTGAVTSVGNATSLGSFSSANLLGALTDETGTGSAVFATSPTLVTPILGTPTSATLTNATGLPIATGVSGLGTGVATFLATPSSANLAAALTDETGSGANVFATSPTLVTPILGTPTSATLTNATGLPLTTGVTGTLPTANGGTNLTSFTSGGVVYASSSSALATGSALVFDGTNMGFGVTPRQVSGQSIEFGGSVARTAINFNNSADAVGWVTANAYYDGTNFLRVFGGGTSSTAYSQNQSGEHRWYLGAAGTANAAITFTQAMTLTAAGKLGIATTSPLYSLQIGDGGADVAIGGAPTGNGSGRLKFINSTTRKNWQISTNDTASGAFEFTRSTAVGGSTFSTPDMVISSTGNVGIGTSSPASGAGADRVLTIAGTASAIVPTLVLAPHVGNAHELISYNGTFSIYNSSTLQASLNNSGGFKVLNTIGVGNATPSSSGAGITFPADATVSASSNANTLDDYEEGTWTPNQGSGLTVVGTFSSSGKYTKIGNLVTVNFQVNGTTSIACSSVGQISTNLPFSIVATTGNAMGSCMNSSNVNTGAYGYLTEIYSSTTALAAAGSIFVTITYLV